MFSEYDKLGIKSKILYKVCHQISFNFSHCEQLFTQLYEIVSSTKKNSILVHMKIEIYKYY